MPTSPLALLLLLAGLVIGLLILYLALAMAGHQSDLERQAEILAAEQRAAQSAEGPDRQC